MGCCPLGPGGWVIVYEGVSGMLVIEILVPLLSDCFELVGWWFLLQGNSSQNPNEISLAIALRYPRTCGEGGRYYLIYEYVMRDDYSICACLHSIPHLGSSTASFIKRALLK